jgi:hypothetical protein
VELHLSDQGRGLEASVLEAVKRIIVADFDSMAVGLALDGILSTPGAPHETYRHDFTGAEK